jgi:hypothetical protein
MAKTSFAQDRYQKSRLGDDVEDEEADAAVLLDRGHGVHEQPQWDVHDAVDLSVAVRVVVKRIRQLPRRNLGTQIGCESRGGDHLLDDFIIRQVDRSLPQRPGLVELVVARHLHSVPVSSTHPGLKNNIKVAQVMAACFVGGEPQFPHPVGRA